MIGSRTALTIVSRATGDGKSRGAWDAGNRPGRRPQPFRRSGRPRTCRPPPATPSARSRPSARTRHHAPATRLPVRSFSDAALRPDRHPPHVVRPRARAARRGIPGALRQRRHAPVRIDRRCDRNRRAAGAHPPVVSRGRGLGHADALRRLPPSGTPRRPRPGLRRVADRARPRHRAPAVLPGLRLAARHRRGAPGRRSAGRAAGGRTAPPRAPLARPGPSPSPSWHGSRGWTRPWVWWDTASAG